MSSESPVLNIAGSAELKNYNRGIMQEIDQINMAKPVTKEAWLVHDAARIPDLMVTAIRTSFEGRRGPTHLTIPTDIQSQHVDEDAIRYYEVASTRHSGPIVGSHEQITEAVRLLRSAERPMVIASTPAAYGDWTEIYERFIETTKLPLMTEEAARGIVSDEHPLCFGRRTGFGPAPTPCVFCGPGATQFSESRQGPCASSYCWFPSAQSEECTLPAPRSSGEASSHALWSRS